MISISKGDLFIEPLEFLLEVLARVVFKAPFRMLPREPVAEWGWSQWLWAGFLLTTALLVVVMLVRAARGRPRGDA